MSLLGATRALGSSIIDGSHLEAGWAALGGDHLFTGSRAPGKGCAAPAAPRKCALLGQGADRRSVGRRVSPMGSKQGKIVVYEPLTQDFALRPRRQLVPVKPIFFLIYQFNFGPLGIIFWGWGSPAFVWPGSAGVDAVVALGRVARTPVPAGRLRPE